ncbi:hypothetical protein LA76x_4062 [Lysobacter antibioticus]|uniref:Secreted protein n=1 Tax=Lysobacter antibioticus TaxID=84531 RepID=A0A0S2FF78_LYSAN|nr:hypothetical protein LA76x_4062 [Lysobacter antibioticus]
MHRRIRQWSLACVFAAGFSIEAAAQENLIVFVGEKLSVEQFEPVREKNVILMDAVFKARYRVEQLVYGEYDGETIEFEAYDHYGVPPFSGFPHALLFVSRDGNRFYHQKYQFYPVFHTASGAWFGCGPVGESDLRDREGIAEAKPMPWSSDAYHPLKPEWSSKDRRKLFAREHFRIDGDKAYCLTGSPVDELFEVKKRTVLKARGMFGGDATKAAD